LCAQIAERGAVHCCAEQQGKRSDPRFYQRVHHGAAPKAKDGCLIIAFISASNPNVKGSR
jgi:hypothetical protein